ncbi:MAG: hypothetical protein HQL50_04805 [Magnetococcales bacterium]|nr:hypothetical protein [Magnetococcales bacterium]
MLPEADREVGNPGLIAPPFDEELGGQDRFEITPDDPLFNPQEPGETQQEWSLFPTQQGGNNWLGGDDESGGGEGSLDEIEPDSSEMKNDSDFPLPSGIYEPRPDTPSR